MFSFLQAIKHRLPELHINPMKSREKTTNILDAHTWMGPSTGTRTLLQRSIMGGITLRINDITLNMSAWWETAKGAVHEGDLPTEPLYKALIFCLTRSSRFRQENRFVVQDIPLLKVEHKVSLASHLLQFSAIVMVT